MTISPWVERSRLWSIVRDITSILGTFAIAIEFVQFFPTLTLLNEFLQQRSIFAVLLISSIIYSVIKNRPKRSFCFKLQGRDAEVELFIGDMDELKGSLVVPINSEFDVYLGGSVGSATSVKAMVIHNYFGGDHEAVKKLIQRELKVAAFAGEKVNGKYKVGTMVQLELPNKSKRFYLVVNSHKVSGRRVRTEIEDFYKTLNGLWIALGKQGAKEDIAVPLLGTGNGRLSLPRQEVYKEIVRSFTAACAARIFCNKLTIVIRQEDVISYQINVQELVEFTKLHTRYADFRVEDSAQRGVGISEAEVTV
jgi:hypothetical protein